MPEKKPTLPPELVQEFVRVAHGDFDRVKELLAGEPGLVNASWDWGGGDWETALGAAAHMGRKDIANDLLRQGARLDLFAAAMLDKIDIVKAIVADDPQVVESGGPHGIPLIVHAEQGKAAAVLAYLRSL
jgi:hypothetical protein